MEKRLRYTFLNLTIIILITIFSSSAFANNLSITNVSLEDRTPSSSTVVIEFDVAWENSWRTKINHDAIWLTVRLHDPAVSPTDKKLCQLTYAGVDPQGVSTGSNSDLEMSIPSDKTGAFLRLQNYSKKSSVSSEGVQLTVDYSTCGFTSSDNISANVFGIEMVLVPQGAFYIGDYDSSTAALDEGSSDSDPWYVSSDDFISVTNDASDGYRYVSAGLPAEDATGTAFTIPAEFPVGFNAFYAMKYEVTEGQWVEFINSLPSAGARANHDLTDGSHKNTDTVLYRNTINCSGTPIVCSTNRPYRSVSYLNWTDLAAFLDWAALRPVTELEFEKAARGPLMPVASEFAWGSTQLVVATSISGAEETGSETVTNTGANVHCSNVVLTGGDAGVGVDHQQGPLRSGIFATGLSTRELAGAGYYGVMELSGNLRERIVTIGNSVGRAFQGTHGDGYLSTASGFEGNANNTDWPGIDADPTRGVTNASGSGFKGGAWDDLTSDQLRISDRKDAANADASAYFNSGGRGVRTYEQ